MRFLWMVLLASNMQAQWFKVATTETPIVFPQGGTYRYGTNAGTTTVGTDCSKGNGCWTTVTVTPGTNVKQSALADPAVGLAKEVDVYQTSQAQSVTVAGTPLTVPAKGNGNSVTYNLTCTGTGTIDSNGNLNSTNLTCTGVKQ